MSGKRLWWQGVGLAIGMVVTAPLFGQTPRDIEMAATALFSLLVCQGFILLCSHLWATYRVRVERREDDWR